MKFTDWLKPIITPLFKKAEEVDLFLSASDLRAVDVPDEMVQAFSKTYLTHDSAYSNEDLNKRINSEALGKAYGSVDQRIKKILPLLAEEDQRAIEGEKNTLLKMDLLEKAFIGASKSEDVKKINERARKTESELHEKIQGLEDLIKKKDEDAAKQVKEIQMDYALRSKISSFVLAPEFSSEKHRNFLADSTISNLKKQFVLEFDDSNNSIIHLRKNVDGQIKDHYEGNVKVTLDDVLTKEFEPYVKKNEKPDGHSNQPPTDNKPIFKVPTDRPMTLEERRKADFAASV